MPLAQGAAAETSSIAGHVKPQVNSCGTFCSKFYVANTGTDSILRFDFQGNGVFNVAPSNTYNLAPYLTPGWEGALAVDTNKHMYTEWFTSQHAPEILVFTDGVNGLDLFTTITGSRTGLNSAAYALALDSSNDLFAGSSNTIPIYVNEYSAADIATQNPNIAPVRTVDVGSNSENFYALAVSSSGRLYVATDQPFYASGNQILAYKGGASGNATPIVHIQGANTGLCEVRGMAIDDSAYGNGRVIVSNYGHCSGTSVAQVLVFGPTSTGNVRPVATISGPDTGLKFPWGVATDDQGDIFVADSVANAVFKYRYDAQGDAVPLAIYQGSRTGLNAPWGLALH